MITSSPLPRPVRLYGYWRSSTAYRVRIALALKGIEVEHVPVNLLEGAHKQPDHLARQPQGLVPALELEDGRMFGQSLAIIDYLDAVAPDAPRLTPADPVEALVVREMAHVVALDIHPVNNLRLLKWLKAELGQPQEEVTRWMHQWMRTGFDALEVLLARHGSKGDWCFGDGPSLADCCLIPQCYNAERFGLSLADWPLIASITENARKHPAFTAAHPDAQPDATE